MDPSVMHIFLVVMALGSPKPSVVDLYDHTFQTVAECKEYLTNDKNDHEKYLSDQVTSLRGVVIPPEGPVHVVYGCRGKEAI